MDYLRLILGLYDAPEKQKQENYCVDLFRSNLAVFGSAMSGKTTLLKTLLIRIHQVVKNNGKEEIYILDFNGGLVNYKMLPFVTGYFDARNEENIRRIIRIIEEKYYYNSKKLKGSNYAEFTSTEKPAHITFIIDGIDAFFANDSISVYHDLLYKITREGLSKGISIVMTANEPSSGVRRMLSSINRIIAFDLKKERYSELYSGKVDKPMIIKGRGVANIDTNVFEFQAYYPYNFKMINDEKNAIEKIVTCLADEHNVPVMDLFNKHLKSFSGELNSNNWHDYTDEKIYIKAYLVAGIDYYTYKSVNISYALAQSIAIYGSNNEGKFNLLRLILGGINGVDNVKIVTWNDNRNQFPDILNNIINDVRPRPKMECFSAQSDIEKYIKDKFFDLPDNVFRDDDSNKNKRAHYSAQSEFTIFIFQHKLFYQLSIGGEGKHLMYRMAQFISDAVKAKCLFVFYDAQSMVSEDVNNVFNNCLNHVFLLDDIVRFVQNKGSKSVFKTLDIADLKTEYGSYADDDCYYFNNESCEITKLKLIQTKQEGQGDGRV